MLKKYRQVSAIFTDTDTISRYHKNRPIPPIPILEYRYITSNFSVLCLNIRSLSNLKNFSKLEGLLSSLTLAPSLIAVTETWLKPNYSESIVNLPGYSFISNPRIQTQGGGVGFYVKDNLVYSTQLDLNRMEEKIFESLFIDVKFKNKNITFGCIYRAPCNDIVSNSSFLDILNTRNTLKRIKKRFFFIR